MEKWLSRVGNSNLFVFFYHPHQVLPFLNRSRWKAEIFTVYVNRVNKLIICTLVIIVGKMTEQSWKILNFLHFCWASTHSLTISKPFKMKSWNYKEWSDTLIICTSVIIVGKMTEQSWKIFNFLHFCWVSTHSLTISKPFKMKSWNYKEWSDTLIVCTSVIVVGKMVEQSWRC